MATGLTAMRAGLAANLAVLKDIQVSPYMLANPTPPTIHVYPSGPAGPILYNLAMGVGLSKWPFTVQAFVGLTGDQAAQVKLDNFIAPSGSTSVSTAIESDQTLGGAATDVQCVSCSGYRIYVMEGRPPVLGAEWFVEVLVTGL